MTITNLHARGGQVLYDGQKSVPLDLLHGDAGWVPTGGTNVPVADDVRRYYEHVGLLYRCVGIRANGLSKVPWVIANEAGDTVWKRGDEPPADLMFLKPLQRLLYKTSAALTLGSQAYWHIERNSVKVTGLRWFAPMGTAPHWDERLGLDYFVRNTGTREDRYDPKEIVYLWYQHPLHETLRDVSPAEAAMREAGVLYNLDEFAAKFFERGAIKATLLTVKGNPPKSEMDRIKQWWKRFFQGVTNAFGAEVLNSEGIEPVVVGEGISELSNTDLTEEKRNGVAITLGVPLSMVFSDAANHATSQQDEQNFYNGTIIPDCELIAEQVDEQLLAEFGYHLVFKPETMDVFQVDENERSQSYAAYVNAGMPPPLVGEMLGLELPDGWDYDDLEKEPEPLAVPMDANGNPVANAQPDPARQAEARRFKAWAAKRTDPDPTRFNSDVLTAADKAALLEEMGGGADRDFFTLRLAHGPITPDAYKAMLLQLDPDDDEAEQRIRDEIERRMARELNAAFGEQLDDLLPDGADDAAIRDAINRVSATSEPVREVLRRNLAQSSSLGVTVALDTLGAIGYGFDWTLAHTDAAQWASQYSYELVRGINQTTANRLQVAVNDWFQERTTLPDLVRELQPTFGRRRAQLIAQTETTRAAREGSVRGFEQSGVVQGVEWATVRDERVCPVCGPLNGQRADLRGMFAGGQAQPPAHPGCRCFVRPVIMEPTL